MTEAAKKTKINSLLRLVLWFLLLLLVIFVLLSFTLSRPKVQKSAVEYLSNRFSEKLEAKFDIESVSIGLQKGLILEGASIINDQGDTLLQSGRISSSLSNNLTSLIKNQLYLKDVYIGDIKINVKEDQSGHGTTWDKILNHFLQKESGSNETGEPKSFLLDVESFVLENFSFSKEANNLSQLIEFERAQIRFDSINIDSNYFHLKSINLVNPVIEHYEDGKKIIDEKLAEQGVEMDDPGKSGSGNSPIFIIDNVAITEGQIWTNDKLGSQSKTAIDYKNLRIDNLNLALKNLKVLGADNIYAELDNLSGILDEKLSLEKTSFEKLQIDKKKILLDGFVLETNDTKLFVNNSMKFRSLDDFSNFSDKVYLDLEFKNSVVSIKDLNYLIPGMSKTNFVNQNLDETILLDGKVKGRVNNFNTNDLKLRVGNKIVFDGKIRVRNITDPNKTLMNIEVDRLNSSMAALTKVIPNFAPPENFYKLTDFQFTGRFDGFVYNFVAFGEVATNLGVVKSDMQLDLTKGRNAANYSGGLELVNFDVGTWSDNPEFDKMSLKTNVKNGSGLELNTVKADVDATLSSFTFRDYLYEELILDGKLEKNRFDGKLKIEDPNANLDFDGFLTYIDGLVTGDFVAKVEQLDLLKLNLSKDSIAISGDMTIGVSGTDIDKFEGDADIKDLILTRGRKVAKFDSLYIVSTLDDDNNRLLNFDSDVANIHMEGKINLQSMISDFKAMFLNDQVEWAEYLKTEVEPLTDNQNFNYTIEVFDSKKILDFFDLEQMHLNGLSASGVANSKLGKFTMNSTLDSLSYNNHAFSKSIINFTNLNKSTDLQFDTETLFLGGKAYKEVDLDAALVDGVLFINADSGNLLDTMGRVNFTIDAKPRKDELVIHIKENNWNMLGSSWAFDNENEIILGHKSLDIHQLVLTDSKRVIEFSSRDKKDVLLHVSNVDLSLINPLIDDPKFLFSGASYINLQTLDVFSNPSLQGSFVVPDLILNGESFGELNLLLENALDDKLKVDLNIIRDSDEQMVVLDAIVDPKTLDIDGILTADNFKLKFFEYIILTGISETAGNFDLSCQVKGTILEPKLNGRAIMNEGAVKVDYLGNKVFFDKQEVRINEKVIDVTGGILTDRLGNEAVLSNGLYHNYFKDMELDLTINSEEFLMLDTDKFDNSSYYGTGIGKASVNFKGPFTQTEIIVNATTGEGTVLNIPVVSTVDGYDESFIQFVEKGKLLDFSQDSLLTEETILDGANVEINLTITPQAEVNIIFNEKLNDVIKGRGNANMRIITERTGTFDIFGQYVVDSGDYLFTALGWVAKPFSVKRGSTITWTGDPLNAQVNIDAEYQGVKTPVDVFLSEYLGTEINSQSSAKAQQNTDVLLSLIISGTLFNPEINFDINFPSLTGELKSYANSKMSVLRANPTDLNDQVVGLLIFGSFLPPEDPLGTIAGNISSAGYNTLSEFVSNELSYLLSGLAAEAFIESGILSGIDFEVGFSKNNLLNGGGSSGLTPDEFEFAFKPIFKNDRWSADIGSNYVRVGTVVSDYAYLDVILEYAITQDRRLKLKIYGNNDFDAFTNERENQFGIGIRYGKEFGTMTEFKEAFKSDIKNQLNPEDTSNN